MRKAQVLMVALLLGLLMAACAPKPLTPAATSTPQIPAAASAPAVASVPTRALDARPAWQVEWDRTLEAAKEEGTVAVATGIGTTVRVTIAQDIG